MVFSWLIEPAIALVTSVTIEALQHNLDQLRVKLYKDAEVSGTKDSAAKPIPTSSIKYGTIIGQTPRDVHEIFIRSLTPVSNLTPSGQQGSSCLKSGVYLLLKALCSKGTHTATPTADADALVVPKETTEVTAVKLLNNHETKALIAQPPSFSLGLAKTTISNKHETLPAYAERLPVNSPKDLSPPGHQNLPVTSTSPDIAQMTTLNKYITPLSSAKELPVTSPKGPFSSGHEILPITSISTPRKSKFTELLTSAKELPVTSPKGPSPPGHQLLPTTSTSPDVAQMTTSNKYITPLTSAKELPVTTPKDPSPPGHQLLPTTYTTLVEMIISNKSDTLPTYTKGFPVNSPKGPSPPGHQLLPITSTTLTEKIIANKSDTPPTDTKGFPVNSPKGPSPPGHQLLPITSTTLTEKIIANKSDTPPTDTKGLPVNSPKGPSPPGHQLLPTTSTTLKEMTISNKSDTPPTYIKGLPVNSPKGKFPSGHQTLPIASTSTPRTSRFTEPLTSTKELPVNSPKGPYPRHHNLPNTTGPINIESRDLGHLSEIVSPVAGLLFVDTNAIKQSTLGFNDKVMSRSSLDEIKKWILSLPSGGGTPLGNSRRPSDSSLEASEESLAINTQVKASASKPLSCGVRARFSKTERADTTIDTILNKKAQEVVQKMKVQQERYEAELGAVNAANKVMRSLINTLRAQVLEAEKARDLYAAAIAISHAGISSMADVLAEVDDAVQMQAAAGADRDQVVKAEEANLSVSSSTDATESVESDETLEHSNSGTEPSTEFDVLSKKPREMQEKVEKGSSSTTTTTDTKEVSGNPCETSNTSKSPPAAKPAKQHKMADDDRRIFKFSALPTLTSSMNHSSPSTISSPTTTEASTVISQDDNKYPTSSGQKQRPSIFPTPTAAPFPPTTASFLNDTTVVPTTASFLNDTTVVPTTASFLPSAPLRKTLRRPTPPRTLSPASSTTTPSPPSLQYFSFGVPNLPNATPFKAKTAEDKSAKTHKRREERKRAKALKKEVEAEKGSKGDAA